MLGMIQPLGGRPVLQLLVTTPATVAVVDAVLGGLIVGAIVLFAGWDPALATIMSVAAGVSLFLLLMAWMARGWAGLIAAVTPRFPWDAA